jgi:hypothetical protein
LQENPKRFFRFNATGLENVKMDEHEQKDDIMIATRDYFSGGSFYDDIMACKNEALPS